MILNKISVNIRGQSCNLERENHFSPMIFFQFCCDAGPGLFHRCSPPVLLQRSLHQRHALSRYRSDIQCSFDITTLPRRANEFCNSKQQRWHQETYLYEETFWKVKTEEINLYCFWLLHKIGWRGEFGDLSTRGEKKGNPFSCRKVTKEKKVCNGWLKRMHGVRRTEGE